MKTRPSLTIPLLLLGVLLFLLILLAAILLTARRASAAPPAGAPRPAAPTECGIFNTRLTPDGIWELEVGCDIYTEWMTPDSITYDPTAYYPNGIILADGTFIQHHLIGCFAQYGCPLTPGYPITTPTGQTQINGYWPLYFPLAGK